MVSLYGMLVAQVEINVAGPAGVSIIVNYNSFIFIRDIQ